MSNFGIIALTPATFQEAQRQPSIAVAAARAGAIGILDLEFAPADFPRLQAIQHMVANADGGCGIKCDIEQLEQLLPLLEPIFAGSQQHCRLVVVTPGLSSPGGKVFKTAVASLHKLGLKVFAETISLDEAIEAQQAGVDAVIAKGHESGGRVGDETSLVLLQRYLDKLKLPVWVQGGIGLHTAAACYAGGAAGVVLDNQLLATRESPLSPQLQAKLARLDGTETVCINHSPGQMYRIYARQGTKPLDDVDSGSDDKSSVSSWQRNIRQAIARNLASARATDQILLLGQDVAFAASLGTKYCTTGGVIQAIRESIDERINNVGDLNILGPGSPLAVSHATRYPIVQGAMTRVSDTADFALSVADGGGLPFLALALMRQAEIESLLCESKAKLKQQSWGVGILGFVPEQLRKEQMEVIARHKPPFALIAGGRPDQAKALEDLGISTYLHVPSPLLLKSFIEMGSRRFIFEGKECGGHVGPRSSFVLWESMIEVLLSSIGPRQDASTYHVLFAGGVHDHRSAAMVAAMAAPLAVRGIAIGVLMGTAYLFTQEAVQTGAIVEKFQEEALKCEKTVLLETGPGHSIRVIESPYKITFDQQRQKLEQENRHRDEVREELELMNLGRLRIASKGVARGSGRASGAADELLPLDKEKQWAEGMYMIGQVAALHKERSTICQLHEDVCLTGAAFLQEKLKQNSQSESAGVMPGAPEVVGNGKPAVNRAEDIAIIGMSCLFPKANDVDSYWHNILNKVDAITEVPKEQWDWRGYYDQDPQARDKISSKWGGFLDPITFDPSRYGIPPSSLASIDPMQILILEAARQALNDAGYGNRRFARDRTSVILANAGHGPITALYSLRSMLDWKLADLPAQMRKQLEDELPEWTEDSFPGYLGNVTAGRVANRFDLGGINFSIDAACASSLAALYVAINELRSGSSDVVLLSATDTHNQPGDYLSFSKTHALSASGRCRTFDATADGIAISEGIAMMVLKRLSEAERDGDRIYAVIKGIGGSSDGKDLSLTAPRPAGQMLALNRAYQNAGVHPGTVGLIEAHGTGTVAGDKAEIEALKQVFTKSGAAPRLCAVGSVKTNIGHTKAAAGLASLIKVAKALHHKVLPPTIGVQNPNPACKFEESPFYINSELRPWIHSNAQHPRRAGISAFGFGGTNFHTILEEYKSPVFAAEEPMSVVWPTELFIVKASSLPDLIKQVDALGEMIKKNPAQGLQTLSYSWYLRSEDSVKATDNLCLSLVSSSLTDLEEKIARARHMLGDPEIKEIKDPRGTYFCALDSGKNTKRIACLFPGQGSQQVNMLRDLALHFPEVRLTLEEADRVLSKELDRPLSTYIYPPPSFTEEESVANQSQLTDTRLAQPAMGAADLAIWRLLQCFGIKADMVAGHSYGEYVALCAAQVLSSDDLLQISARRGQILSVATDGGMIAVAGRAQEIEKILGHRPDITMANINAPQQCILSGKRKVLEEALQTLQTHGLHARFIAVSAAFHSPHMKAAQKELESVLNAAEINAATCTVYSNTTAAPYPDSKSAIASQLGQHLVSPVRFQQQIENMYRDGAEIFIEVGPGAVLSNLVDAILGEAPHLSITADRAGRHGITQLQHLLGQLAAQGVALDVSPLFKARSSALQAQIVGHQIRGEEGKPRKSLSYQVNSASIWASGSEAPVKVAAGSFNKVAEGNVLAAPSRITPSTAGNVAANAVGDSAAGQPLGPVQAAASPQGKQSNRPPAEQALWASGDPKNSSPAVLQKLVQGAIGLSNTRETQSAGLKHEGNGQGDKGGGKSNHNSIPLRARGQSQAAVDQVMLQFQQTMLQMTNNFLQAQQNVMLAYLQSAGTGNPDPATSIRLQQAMQQLPAPQILPEFSGGNGNGHGHPDGREVVATVSAQPMSADSHVDPTTELSNSELVSPVVRVAQSAQGVVDDHKSDQITADQLIAGLLDIVSQRTGYPLEMLDPTLDLEADLGIDSIKRVEILSSFRKLLPEAKLQELEGGIEKLAGTKTLQGIIDWIRSTPGQGEERTSLPGSGSAAIESRPAAQPKGEVSRGLIAARELPAATGTLAVTGPVLIIADSKGLAQSLAKKLKAGKIQSIVVAHGQNKRVERSGIRQANLLNEQSVQALAKELKDEFGSIGSLIHLGGLDEQILPAPGADEGFAPAARSFFLLCKALKAELTGRTGEKPALIMTATTLGGDFGCTADGDSLDDCTAMQAAVVGMIKTIAREWTDVRAKAVDFSANLSAAQMADYLMAEIASDEQIVEVGYRGHQRLGLEIIQAFIGPQPASKLVLDKSSVVLITGGARGITAEIAAELAKRYQPTLILVGRVARPESNEPSYTAGLTSARELKAAIIESLRQDGQTVSVAAVESVYQKLLKEREVRANLALLEGYGSAVRYYSSDVRNSEEFGQLIGRIYESFGRIDGVIHGAGVIEDAWIHDKKLESFDRVMQTKINGALTLTRNLQLNKLQFLFFFSSVVGRTGNAGQIDYVAANEVLNKLAVRVNQKTSARVASLMWGPWNGGMAPPELEEAFARFGWSMIEPSAGRESFMAELLQGQKIDAEVLLVGQLKSAASVNDRDRQAESADMDARPAVVGFSGGGRLHNAQMLSRGPGLTEFKLSLNTREDLYLNDHCFDGIPVLPMAMTVELFAQAACCAYPGWQIAAIKDLEIPAGLMLESNQKDISLLLKEISRNVDGVTLEISLESGIARRTHFRANLEMAPADRQGQPAQSSFAPLPAGITTVYETPNFQQAEAVLPCVSDIYQKWLFHGPMFQGIGQIGAMGTDGIAGVVSSSSPQKCLLNSGGNDWLIDPILLDSTMQLAGVWARHYMDITVLPTGFKRLQVFRRPLGTNLKGLIQVPESSESELNCNLAIYAEDGTLAMVMEGLGGIGSKSFNRLAAQPKELRAQPMTLSGGAYDLEQMGAGKHAPGGVAIVGMSCLFPGAKDVQEFWMNIVDGVDAIREAPWKSQNHNSWGDPFSDVYCASGGFIDELADFDPLKYGIMPNSVFGADPDQFLALKTAVQAFHDAGYEQKSFAADRAEVILGRTSAPGVGALSLIQRGQNIEQVIEILRVQCPDLTGEQLGNISRQMQDGLPPCNADTIPGVMPNVLSGRIANRLGFRGRNLIVDAACASSLIAVEMGVKDLLSGECDLVIAGGIHVNSNAFFYQMFCGLGALSHQGQIRPFDATADGTILGEGVGMVVLKRTADAISDRDRIYALIKGVGSSSDGRTGSPLAPSVDGEVLAMEKAYRMAGVSPGTVSLLEAHGTGTAAGDVAEMEAVHKVFGQSNTPWCALGSVKSMIGHCQAASGIAGLIKSALSLYHRVLPRTLNVSQPNPKISWSESPCYINLASRPWIHPVWDLEQEHPRRAAVSAFGFGGINSHVVLEECSLSGSMEAPPARSLQSNLMQRWQTELCILKAASQEQLVDKIRQLQLFLRVQPNASLKDVAYTLASQIAEAGPCCRLALVASSVNDLGSKLEVVLQHLQGSAASPINGAAGDNLGIYYRCLQAAHAGQLAFLLPGLGAAYPNMLAELCLHFPEIREIFDAVDWIALKGGESTLPSKQIFPASADNNVFTTAMLAGMDSAVVTVLMTEWALFNLLKNLDIHPDALMGCSTGEFASVVMSGAVDIHQAVEMFYRLSTSVARSIPRDKLLDLSSIRVDAPYAQVEGLLKQVAGAVYLTADLGPGHIVLSGSRPIMKKAAALLADNGIVSHVLPIAIPYHTPLVDGVIDLKQKEVQDLPISIPEIPAWSCSTASIYPQNTEDIRRITTDLFTKPILLRPTIEAMYASGVRTFVEVGPRGSLTTLLEDILQDRPHLALACDLPNRGSITQLNHMLAALCVSGVSMSLNYLFDRRSPQQLDFADAPLSLPGTTRLLDLSYPRLFLSEAEPGQGFRLTEGSGLSSGESGDCQSSEQMDAADLQIDSAEQRLSSVVAGYIETLNSFHEQVMQAQTQVMSSYFLQAQSGAEAGMVSEIDDGMIGNLPFLKSAEIIFHENSVNVCRTLQLSEDRYLLDHAIGGRVTALQSDGKVFLLPLMVALEIMCEAGSLLSGNLIVSRIENVRAYRRIRIDGSGCFIQVVAKQSGERILVEITDVHQNAAGRAVVLMSCEVIFADSYPDAVAVPALKLVNQRESKIGSDNLYGPATMFHGPRMQSVIELKGVGDRGTIGRLHCRQPQDWFAFDPEFCASTAFLIDPLLLDNASQLVLYHLFEANEPVIALLPFYIEAIEFFKPTQDLARQVSGQAQMLAITQRGTEATVEVIDADGKLWSRMRGISSRRIIVPELWSQFIADPIERRLASSLTQLVQMSPANEVACAAIELAELPADEGTLDWCTDYVLSPAERKYWLTELQAEKRKREWLMGRIAVKEAVRDLIQSQHNVRLALADIEIRNLENGAPIAGGIWFEQSGVAPQISISHTSSKAVAVAGFLNQPRCLGIDVEQIATRGSDFEELSFQNSERAMLDASPVEQRAFRATALWSAKEALGKALQLDLSEWIKSCHLKTVDWDRGLMFFDIPAQSHGHYASASIVVHVHMLGDLAFALTTGQSAEQLQGQYVS